MVDLLKSFNFPFFFKNSVLLLRISCSSLLESAQFMVDESMNELRVECDVPWEEFLVVNHVLFSETLRRVSHKFSVKYISFVFDKLLFAQFIGVSSCVEHL